MLQNVASTLFRIHNSWDIHLMCSNALLSFNHTHNNLLYGWSTGELFPSWCITATIWASSFVSIPITFKMRSELSCKSRPQTTIKFNVCTRVCRLQHLYDQVYVSIYYNIPSVSAFSWLYMTWACSTSTKYIIWFCFNLQL